MSEDSEQNRVNKIKGVKNNLPLVFCLLLKEEETRK